MTVVPDNQAVALPGRGLYFPVGARWAGHQLQAQRCVG